MVNPAAIRPITPEAGLSPKGGLDKVQHRHHIGRIQDGWSRAEAVRAVKFALSAPPENIIGKTDDWGIGWNFTVYAVGGGLPSGRL